MPKKRAWYVTNNALRNVVTRFVPDAVLIIQKLFSTKKYFVVVLEKYSHYILLHYLIKWLTRGRLCGMQKWSIGIWERLIHHASLGALPCWIILSSMVGGIRGTVVARWTAGQQVERAILRQAHDTFQNSSHLLRLFPAQYSLISVESWPKTLIIHSCRPWFDPFVYVNKKSVLKTISILYNLQLTCVLLSCVQKWHNFSYLFNQYHYAVAEPKTH